MNFSETIKEWISIYAPTVGKGRNPKKTPYEILNNGHINCPEGFILNYSGPGHPAYKRNFNNFPACIRIDNCGNYFNARGGAFLNSIIGFPEHVFSESGVFNFIISTASCNIDYMLACLNLARKWVANDSVDVDLRIEIGKIINGADKYFSFLVKLNNDNLNKWTEKDFIYKLFGMISVLENDELKMLLSDAADVYYHNKNNKDKWEYGHQRVSNKSIDDKKFEVTKSSKYFPIIDVLIEVQKNNTKDGIIKLQTEAQKKKFQKDCKFYAEKLYGNTPAIKMFINNNLYAHTPDNWVNFISSVEFHKELMNDPKGSKLNQFALSRDARSEISKEDAVKKSKKKLSELGIFYSTDDNTLRLDDVDKIWAIQRIDPTYFDPENPKRKKLTDTIFIEARNAGVFDINEYRLDLKYYYCNIIGMSVDNLVNTRIRKYETYLDNPEYVIEDNRSSNGGDIRDMLGKN